MDSLATSKRARESDSSEDVSESPEAKRIREDLLLNILDADDDDDAATPGDGGDSDGTNDLASVMRIFEEEIALLPSDPENPMTTDLDPEPAGTPRQPDLGYLLEASDDELGLPPPSSERETEAEAEVEVVGEVEPTGFGKIWGYGDEIYEPLDFGLDRVAAGGFDDGVVFEEGLFEYSDAFCPASDFADLAWRPESLPAV